MIHREWIKEIRNTAPRIHCITNYVTAGDVANMILAVGGSPIMAQGIREVEDVTTICHGLVLNMGTAEMYAVWIPVQIPSWTDRSHQPCPWDAAPAQWL